VCSKRIGAAGARASGNARLVCFDLDGTLAESKREVSPDMARLVDALAALVPVAIVSGASAEQIESQFAAALLPRTVKSGNVYLVPTNGAALYGYSRGRWRAEYEVKLSREEVRKVREAFARASGKGLVPEPKETWGEVVEDRGTQVTYSGLGGDAPLEKKAAWDPDRKIREPLAEFLRAALPGFSVRLGGTTSIDITREGISKARGVKELCARLNVSPAEAIYVGDALYPGGNDEPALEACLGERCIAPAPVEGPGDTARFIGRTIAGLMPRAGKPDTERPWGAFWVLAKNEPVTLKIIRVSPNQATSLQRHGARAERWIVLAGEAVAHVEGAEATLGPGSVVDVPLGAVHRLGAGPEGALILETSTGQFDERDIEHIEDRHGRGPGRKVELHKPLALVPWPKGGAAVLYRAPGIRERLYETPVTGAGKARAVTLETLRGARLPNLPFFAASGDADGALLAHAVIGANGATRFALARRDAGSEWGAAGELPPGLVDGVPVARGKNLLVFSGLGAVAAHEIDARGRARYLGAAGLWGDGCPVAGAAHLEGNLYLIVGVSYEVRAPRVLAHVRFAITEIADDEVRTRWVGETPAGAADLPCPPRLIGVLGLGERITVAWAVGAEVRLAEFRAPRVDAAAVSEYAPLHRAPQNPIASPRDGHPWEEAGVFNPTAVELDGAAHIFYRAVDGGGVSRVGYQRSQDGVSVDHREASPVYVPRARFECGPGLSRPAWVPDSPFASGGGWGGCEDPKATIVAEDNRLYLTYVAHDGSSDPRVAISWISLDDLRAGRWRWAEPALMSRPNQVNKSAILLPKKINGKYVMFHRVFPDVLVDVRDRLDDFGPGNWLGVRAKIPPRPHGWDSRKLSIAAAPIETSDGWLAVYHAVDERDPGRYKIGAMLLDRAEPWRVIGRTPEPILAPDAWYENDGKAGVAYPSGALAKGGELFVYYGGGDRHCCVARAPLGRVLGAIEPERGRGPTFHAAAPEFFN
jgi:HAD superfamily hydrolase (TIGR01484 family)